MAEFPRALLICHDPAYAPQLAQALRGQFQIKIVGHDENVLGCPDEWAPALTLYASALPELESLLASTQTLQQMRDFQLAAIDASGELISAKNDTALDEAINHCLEKTGRLLLADRCHVFCTPKITRISPTRTNGAQTALLHKNTGLAKRHPRS